MVYGVVIGALFFLTVKGYYGKRISCYVNRMEDSLLFNFLRMLFCCVIGIVLIFAQGYREYLNIDIKMLMICAFSGIANAMFLTGWLLAVQKNTMVSVDVSLTMGSIIPALLCAILFGESVSIPKMIGFLMILLSIFILSKGDKTAKNRGWSGIFLLILAAVGDGMSGFAQQLYRQHCAEDGNLLYGAVYPKTIFHFYTFFFSALFLLIVFIGYNIFSKGKKSAAKKKEKAFAIPIKVVIYIFIMAICLFAANYLQTIAANDYNMPSQILYPVIKGGCLITVSITAMLFWGEKITPRSVLGILVTLAGIVCMSIL